VRAQTDRVDDVVEVAGVAEARDQVDELIAVVGLAAQEDTLAGQDARVPQADLRRRLGDGRVRLLDAGTPPARHPCTPTLTSVHCNRERDPLASRADSCLTATRRPVAISRIKKVTPNAPFPKMVRGRCSASSGTCAYLLIIERVGAGHFLVVWRRPGQRYYVQ